MNELQDRLQHLVNYSSQLIFVSGDTIAQQQRSLEDFLSVQQENTEISYIQAESEFSATDYRRLICRHLLEQTVGSYVRPLKDLLTGLHRQTGPFLVCIKNSENLPNEFLQELWEWVVDSRKQSNHQHLNIILFGESHWAEHAKEWLPAKNSDKPVLLSNHAVASNQFDEAALQDLMAESGGAHSRARVFDAASRSRVLSNRWFILVVLLVFLISFIGIISWQYPQYVQELLKTGSLPEIASETVDDHQENKLASATLQERSATLNDPQTTVSTPDSINVEIVEEDPFSASQILVRTWQSDNSDDEQASQQLPLDQERNNITAQTETNIEASDFSTQNESNQGDFAVPDIINVEQLDAVLGNQLTDDDFGNIELEAPDSQRNAFTNINSAYRFDEQILLSLPDGAVLLQLSGIQNPSVLNNFIQSNSLEQQTWIYETRRYGGPWYVVLYNQAFSSLDQARQSVEDLPTNVKASSPFAKAALQVKQEIQSR